MPSEFFSFDNGLPPPPDITEEEKRYILQYAGNYTHMQIAKELKRSVRTIGYWAKKLGIKYKKRANPYMHPFNQANRVLKSNLQEIKNNTQNGNNKS
jgi:hypothetical protein